MSSQNSRNGKQSPGWDPRLLACRAIDSIRINSLRSEVREGRLHWIKERQPAAAVIIPAANRFFRASNNPVMIHGSIERWRDWEVECYLQLNGKEYSAFPEGARAVCAAAVPGTSLCSHLNHGTLTEGMMKAAGLEFRRVHGLWHSGYNGPWSHSDPHSGNVIFDEKTERARLIDFETMHDQRLTPDERHADDLLVILQDLVGRLPKHQWPDFPLQFLAAYDRPDIVKLLPAKLRVPNWGVPRLWWAIRTTCMKTAELRRRLDVLREAIL